MSTQKLKIEKEAEGKSFTIEQLQNIGLFCSVLKICDGVQPFALANKINSYGTAVEAAAKGFNSELELIREREKTASNPDQTAKDLNELVNKKYVIDAPEIKQAEFAQLEISGEKEVILADGSVRKFNYRDAYFILNATKLK